MQVIYSWTRPRRLCGSTWHVDRLEIMSAGAPKLGQLLDSRLPGQSFHDDLCLLQVSTERVDELSGQSSGQGLVLFGEVVPASP